LSGKGQKKVWKIGVGILSTVRARCNYVGLGSASALAVCVTCGTSIVGYVGYACGKDPNVWSYESAQGV
jgi:hypothetical protein